MLYNMCDFNWKDVPKGAIIGCTLFHRYFKNYNNLLKKNGFEERMWNGTSCSSEHRAELNAKSCKLRNEEFRIQTSNPRSSKKLNTLIES